MKGIDVSRWQPVIDWSKVRSDGVEFAILKATQGTTIKDSCFESHYAGAKSAGIKVGAYHFATFTTVGEAKAEAEFFLAALAGKQFEFPVALDMEDLPNGASPQLSKIPRTKLTDYASAFCEVLEAAGYWVMIYSNKDWLLNKLEKARLDRYALWLAQWYDPKLGKPAWCPNIGIWQWGAGKINGIAGDVDGNIAYIDYSVPIKERGLNGWGGKGNTHPAPPPPVSPGTTSKEGLYRKALSDARDIINKALGEG